LINTTIKEKKNYYGINKINDKMHIYICIHNTPGQIFLWNLTTDMLRIVIHPDYENPDHNGPISGGGTTVDHLNNAPAEFQKYRERR